MVIFWLVSVPDPRTGGGGSGEVAYIKICSARNFGATNQIGPLPMIATQLHFSHANTCSRHNSHGELERERDWNSDRSDVHETWIPHSESRAAGSRERVFFFFFSM